MGATLWKPPRCVIIFNMSCFMFVAEACHMCRPQRRTRRCLHLQSQTWVYLPRPLHQRYQSAGWSVPSSSSPWLSWTEIRDLKHQTRLNMLIHSRYCHQLGDLGQKCKILQNISFIDISCFLNFQLIVKCYHSNMLKYTNTWGRHSHYGTMHCSQPLRGVA